MKGIYILVIEVSRNFSTHKFTFEKSFYAYVGSAQNSLEKRIARHLQKEKKLRWHIDWLLSSKFAKVKEIWVKEASRKEECKIAKILEEHFECVKNFGCSDCKCKSHLFRISEWQFLFQHLGFKPIDAHVLIKPCIGQ
jgi:Uri superfamily endonuclease